MPAEGTLTTAHHTVVYSSIVLILTCGGEYQRTLPWVGTSATARAAPVEGVLASAPFTELWSVCDLPNYVGLENIYSGVPGKHYYETD